ncbi:MAG: redoxin domain-containing protein [Verrucomicrobiota bacterium]
MKSSIVKTLSLASVIAGSALLNAAKVGYDAPEFKLTDISGTEHSLSDFSGKYVVLEWVNPACPFVKKHYSSGNMQSLQEKWTDKGVVWLSIESTKPEHPQYFGKKELAKFTKKAETHSTAFLLDEGGKVGKLYDARTTPHMYIISPEGKLIYNGAIDSISSSNPKDVEKAENYVSAALYAAKSGEEVSKSTTRAYGCSVKY